MSYFSAIEWPRPFLQLYEFVGLFLMAGAIGFRYSALWGRLDTTPTFQRMGRHAAWLGVIGVLLTIAHLMQALPNSAHRAKLPPAQFLTHVSVGSAYYWLTALGLIGFLLAAVGNRVGWPIAVVGIIGGHLRNLFVGQWVRLVTPIHSLTAGLWLGTLFVLVVAGLSVLLRHDMERDTRGGIVADMVNAFSPLALVCGGLVVLFGVIAAFRQLKPFSALWTTFYGYTLIAKLCVVAVVFALGAWNYRRQRPTLGTEAAAHSIRHSATLELIAATVVLIVTSIMLSLPEPR